MAARRALPPQPVWTATESSVKSARPSASAAEPSSSTAHVAPRSRMPARSFWTCRVGGRGGSSSG
eukprot:196171-Chlamydomonas_euryale.AAC.4